MIKRLVNLLLAGCAIQFIGMNQSLSAQVIVQDSLALVALYNSTNGAGWTNRTNWLAGPVNTWFGVLVGDQRVTSLKLNKNNMTGPLPVEIGNLSNMSVLQLKENYLAGGIPAVIWDMTNLKDIRLSYNALTGSLPPQISNLKKLEWLVLENNQFSGPLPSETGSLSALMHLYLANNQFNGPIPPELGNCTLMDELFLQSNRFTGNIPPSLGNMKSCTRLHLYGNQLTGTIPPQIGNCCSLWELCLYNNQLEGGIPPELGNLSVLYDLLLYNNRLTGQIPSAIFSSPNLRTLRLNDNQLEGGIPEAIGNCAHLEQFRVNNNKLSGNIPAGLANITELKYIYLNYNQFTDLPNLSSLASLKTLNVYSNRFTFEDIEPNIGIPGFSYGAQDSVGAAIDTTVAAGQSLTLSVQVGGTANQYQWLRNKVAIAGATAASYQIASAGTSNEGKYNCKITNTIAPLLTLYSRTVRLTVSGGTGISGSPEPMPDGFVLHQNYPNPFNPTTRINYSLPKSGPVQLSVFDLQGRLITTLVNGLQSVGPKSTIWNGLDDRKERAPSGVYVYRIHAGNFSDMKKMILAQ